MAKLTASFDRVRNGLQPDTMAVLQYDVRRTAADGGGFEVRYWSPRNSPLLDPLGRLAHIVHEVVDVTEFVRRDTDERLTKDFWANTGSVAYLGMVTGRSCGTRSGSAISIST